MNLSEAAAEPYQIAYNEWQVTAAHALDLAIGLKNSVGFLETGSSAASLVESYDFGVNESCQKWSECAGYQEAFLDRNKAVFATEYSGTLATVCANQLNGLATKLNLGTGWQNCFQATTAGGTVHEVIQQF